MTQIDKADTFVASLGVEAYRVGGSVRDELMGRVPKDADYMVRGVDLNALKTKLNAAATKKVAPIKLRQGGQFGWRVEVPGAGLIEITLPRTEVSDGPGRAMRVKVDPNLSLEDDAKRRDFTFNALYSVVANTHATRGMVFDPTGRGLHDLERKYIATTHPDSFRDDPLRMLRALRFVARGFDLAEYTREQMTASARFVDGLTAHGYTSGTLLDELRKILEGDHAADALRVARDTGVLAVAIPELADMLRFDQQSRYHDLTTDEHTFVAIDAAAKAKAPLRVRFALLFHDSGKPDSGWMGSDGRLHYYEPSGKEEARLRGPLDDETWAFVKPKDHEVNGVRRWREFCARVNAGKDLREDVATLIKHHMLTAKPKRSTANRMRVKFGDDLMHDLILHRTCDIMGKGKIDAKQMAAMGAWVMLQKEAQAAKVPASIKDLQITGKDVMAAGLEGPAIGEAMRRVLDAVIVQPSEQKLTRDWQLSQIHNDKSPAQSD